MQNSYKRVDAHLSSLGYCTRSEAKKFLRIYELTVNDKRVFDTSIKAYHNDIKVNNEPIDPETITILLNKPSGFICSHNDAGSLIYALIPQRWNRRNPKISTIGRLDVDTTGAIILTDDGALNHKLSSPKSDVSKVYEATLAVPLKGDEKEIFASGELMLNGEKKPLLPATLEVLGETHVRLEICEGKYHQVKRMFAAVGNRVLTLHRVSFGEYTIEDLKEGEYKFIEL
ncbi:RsuA-like pseudouridine synthase [Arcobacter venerupis]|uniref:Pseudouridine synthase n=1 Tax=Arcobacter venerupis TaxID=1054033 RepID=A0AAE7BAL6_9BACT|nr:16S rRNA pseudouridine(516) synthase [Arcobacter venerupis]QKF66975.1 RsuA-like pseudouridine synthase [Arcobacter venerupis]RWS50076.1 16S rRNA pseudouridine(516) synthase [Arcobacter venerupis]